MGGGFILSAGLVRIIAVRQRRGRRVSGGPSTFDPSAALRARNEHASVRPAVHSRHEISGFARRERGGREGGRDGVGRVPPAIICQRVCSVCTIRKSRPRPDRNFALNYGYDSDLLRSPSCWSSDSYFAMGRVPCFKSLTRVLRPNRERELGPLV